MPEFSRMTIFLSKSKFKAGLEKVPTEANAVGNCNPFFYNFFVLFEDGK